MNAQNKLRYPIGKFKYGKTYSHDETRKHMKVIARLPKELKKTFKKLRGSELDMSYRKGGWTVRQVVHHLADSHMNAYIRMKLAVTEPTPIIKPYEEGLWAETEDGKTASVKLSLKLLTPLHRRWLMFLESLSEEDLDCGYFHPSMQRVIPLPEAIALYAWHCQHHVAHIRLVADGKSRYEKTEKSAASKRRQKSTMPKSVAIAPAGRKKPVLKLKAKQPVTSVRKRRSKVEMEAFRAQQNAKPKLTRAEVLAKARAARGTKTTQQAPKKIALATPKRKRRSSAEVAAEKAAKAAMPKLTRTEVLAKARAARAAKSAQQGTKKVVLATPKRKRRSSAEVAAEKATKAAMPKLSRAEILAKARAARAVKTARQTPKKVTKTTSSGETKRKGLSPERMAEIRAMRKKKA